MIFPDISVIGHGLLMDALLHQPAALSLSPISPTRCQGSTSI